MAAAFVYGGRGTPGSAGGAGGLKCRECGEYMVYEGGINHYAICRKCRGLRDHTNKDEEYGREGSE